MERDARMARRAARAARSRAWRSARCATGSSPGTSSTRASRTRGPRYRALGAPRTLLLGFSMGGAVAIAAADEPAVDGVLGLAPWIPDRLDARRRSRGKRLDVLHGSLDRWLPGIPGVSPAASRRGFERAQALGVDGHYTLIPRRACTASRYARPGAARSRSRAPALGAARRGRSSARSRPAEARRRAARSARRPAPSRSRRAAASRARGSPTTRGRAATGARPCRAEAGNAWWLLCQPSPKTSIGDDPVVPRLVARAVVPAAEHVADRVHAERRVLVERRSGPARPRRAPRRPPARSADRVADRERDPEREHDPEQVQPVDRADQPVLVEVLAVHPPRSIPMFVNIQPTWAWTKPCTPPARRRRARRAASAGRPPCPTARGACGGPSPTASAGPASSCSRGSRAPPSPARAPRSPVGEVAVEADRRPERADDVQSAP